MNSDECRPVFPAARHKNRGTFEVEGSRGRARRRWGKRAGIRCTFTLLALAFACGCAGGKYQLKAPAGLVVAGVVVYPVSFRWEEPAWRAFELTQRLIDVALQENGGRLSYFGPSEFRVIKSDEDAAWVGSTALPLVTKSGVQPEQSVLLRPWVEKRVNSSFKEAEDAHGRTKARANGEQTTYVAHVEVAHPSTGQVLLEVQGEVTVDPFEAAARAATQDIDADPAPELTALMEGLMADAAKALNKSAVKREQPRELPYTLALTPGEAMRYAPGQDLAARLSVATKDVAESEVFFQSRAMFANPRLPAEVAARLSRLPPGLYVVAAPSGAPLKAGDLILGVEGQTALPQVLARARLSGSPPQLKVRRATGGEEDVYLP